MLTIYKYIIVPNVPGNASQDHLLHHFSKHQDEADQPGFLFPFLKIINIIDSETLCSGALERNKNSFLGNTRS